MGKATSKYEALHKEGFSFRALFPTINILPGKGERKKKKKPNSCRRAAFILEAEKETNKRSSKQDNLSNKVLFGQK